MVETDEEKKAAEEAEAKAKAEADAKAAEETPAEDAGANKVVDDAKEIVAVMKKENDRKEKNLEREEKLAAKNETLQSLGGGSPAGGGNPEPAEETPGDYAKRVQSNNL